MNIEGLAGISHMFFSKKIREPSYTIIESLINVCFQCLQTLQAQL